MSTLARATVKSCDASTHSATVQISGSLAVWLDAVPVSAGIAPADVVAGRECGVIFFTDDNPTDAAVVTIHNVVPTGWPAPTAHVIKDADASTYVDTEQSANEDKVRVGVGGTERYLVQTASPHHTLTGDVLLTGNLCRTDDAPDANILAQFQTTAGADGKIGLCVDFGQASTIAAHKVIGIAGNALANQSSGGAITTTTAVYGLNFTAGMNFGNNPTGTLAAAAVINAIFAAINNSGMTLTYGSFLKTSFTFTGTNHVTTFVGLDVAGTSSTAIGTAIGLRVGSYSGSGVVAVPLDLDGPARTTDTDGSVHRMNIQFGSRTRKFGGGDGVIGLTYATTNPVSNPAGGVIIYADGGTGDVKIRGAGGNIVKLPSGGATNVTGSRGGNAALANLLTVLNGLGLIVDGTTA
jgi:hypothetical protein